MTTWRKEITEQMQQHGESFADVVASTLTDAELDAEFDDGYGQVQGIPFTIWTSRRVYFPGCYDGLEFVDSVSRFPDGIPTKHVGGG